MIENLGNLIGGLEQLRSFKEAMDSVSEGKSTEEILKAKLGVPPERAKELAAKMEDLRQKITEALISGKIQSQDDLLNMIRDANILHPDDQDGLLEKIRNMSAQDGEDAE